MNHTAVYELCETWWSWLLIDILLDLAYCEDDECFIAWAFGKVSNTIKYCTCTGFSAYKHTSTHIMLVIIRHRRQGPGLGEWVDGGLWRVCWEVIILYTEMKGLQSDGVILLSITPH